MRQRQWGWPGCHRCSPPSQCRASCWRCRRCSRNISQRSGASASWRSSASRSASAFHSRSKCRNASLSIPEPLPQYSWHVSGEQHLSWMEERFYMVTLVVFLMPRKSHLCSSQWFGFYFSMYSSSKHFGFCTWRTSESILFFLPSIFCCQLIN